MENMMKYKGYIGSIEASLEDNCLYGSIQHINDVVTYEGQTVPELKQAFKEQVNDYLLMCEEIGKNPDKPYKGTFNVRIGPDLHRELAVFARKNDDSINAIVKEAVSSYLRQPKEPMTKSVHLHLRLSPKTKVVKESDLYKSKSEWGLDESLIVPASIN